MSRIKSVGFFHPFFFHLTYASSSQVDRMGNIFDRLVALGSQRESWKQRYEKVKIEDT